MFDKRSFSATRFAVAAASVALLACALVLSGARPARALSATDMTGVLPPLQFTMTRATDGKVVTAADYKGKIVLLYFGYTYCPDVCPTTLFNISNMLKKLGPQAKDVRVLFVTVDPNRDSLKVLKEYTDAFAPQIVGLRGTQNELATLAKRYRVAYSVTPASPGHPYEVSHSAGVYVFNRSGDIKLLFTNLSLANANIMGNFDDLQDLVAQSGLPSLWQRVRNVF
ncbi:MAG: SCO family protein [Xanthobacteraceae bacterium]